MADLISDARDSIEALAIRLACATGRSEPISVRPITGGGNNRVLHLAMKDGDDLILKCYFTSPHDKRDRLGAEWDFLTYAWQRGIRSVPQPLAIDRSARAALYRFVVGRKPKPDEIDAAAVDAAAEFILKVNSRPRELKTMRDASEACFSLAQHLVMIDRRVERLAVLDPESHLLAEAESFVVQRLRPAWARVRNRIVGDAKKHGVALAAPLRADEICLSPSDFGFHNALIGDDGHIVFIDFEYAGCDDPAKLICDFFCQPALPAPLVYYERFAARVFDGLEFGAAHAARSRALLDAYRIKWVCIILNDFLPVGAARRAFADTGARAERCAMQLVKADEKLALVSAH